MTKVQSQPIMDEPTPDEFQAWADEAQACIDSGEVIIGDHRKARATVDALRSHAALVKALEDAQLAIEASIEMHGPDVAGTMLATLNQIDTALSQRSAKT